MRLMRVLLALLIAALPLQARAQQSLQQGGSTTAGHVPMYIQSGTSQPIVIDAGPAGGNTTGQGLSELNITARGSGSSPHAGQGTGQLGTIFQIQDAISTNATGYHALSFSANAQSGGLIAYNAFGTATALPLNLNINGTTYSFPFSISGIVGPSTSIINDVVCWNNLVGTLVKDCGGTIQLSGSSSGTTTLSAAATASGVLTLPNATDTLVGKATTDAFTNKTFNTAATGNVLQINSTTVNALTGTGSTLVASVSPALTGTPTAPTAAPGTNTTQIATMAALQAAVVAPLVRVQTFTSTGTYTPNAHMLSAVVECVGGGGAGGGAASVAAIWASAGSGGSGSYSRKYVTAADIGAFKAVTIGAAGTVSAVGPNTGGNGGDTSLGSLCIGKGGRGGVGNPADGSATPGGAGGVAGTGDITSPGMNGGPGMTAGASGLAVGANGGSNLFGAGGLGPATFSTGVSGTGFGAGGAGGYTLNSGATAGGAGTAGYIVVTEYCSQ